MKTNEQYQLDDDDVVITIAGGAIPGLETAQSVAAPVSRVPTSRDVQLVTQEIALPDDGAIPTPVREDPVARGKQGGGVQTQGYTGGGLNQMEEPIIDEGEEMYGEEDEYAIYRRPTPRRTAQRRPTQKRTIQPPHKGSGGLVWGAIASVRDKIPFSVAGDSKSVEIPFKNRKAGAIMFRLHIVGSNTTAAPIVFSPLAILRRMKGIMDQKVSDPTIDVDEGISLGLLAALGMQTAYPEIRGQYEQEGIAPVTVPAAGSIDEYYWVILPGPFEGEKMKIMTEMHSLSALGFTSGLLEMDIVVMDASRAPGRGAVKYLGFKKTATNTGGIDQARAFALYRPGLVTDWPDILKINLNGGQGLSAVHIATFQKMYPYGGMSSIPDSEIIHMEFPGDKFRVDASVDGAADDLYVAGLGFVEDKTIRTSFEHDQYDAVVDDEEYFQR